MNCKNLEKYSELVYTLLTVYNCTFIPGKIKIVPAAVEGELKKSHLFKSMKDSPRSRR